MILFVLTFWHGLQNSKEKALCTYQCDVYTHYDIMYIDSIYYRRLEWYNLEATVTEDNAIQVKDVLTEAQECLG